MADLQDHHWWFGAKRRIVAGVLARHLDREEPARGATGRRHRAPSRDDEPETKRPDPGRRPLRVLEVGCGTGAMLPVLERWGGTVALDAHEPALVHVAGGERIGGDVGALPLRDASFDLVASFDVLYHRRVADVEEALGELYRVCAPGGFLILTDSAFPVLRGPHDASQHGARRFRLGELLRSLERWGFRPLHATYFHTLLFPPAAVLRLVQRWRHGSDPSSGSIASNSTGRRPRVSGRSDMGPVPPWLNRLLGLVYRLEAPLASRFRLPFGLSLLALVRRPS